MNSTDEEDIDEVVRNVSHNSEPNLSGDDILFIFTDNFSGFKYHLKFSVNWFILYS